MDFLIAFFTAFTVSIQSIIKRKYNDRVNNGLFLFCTISSAFACLFFIITAKDLSFRIEQLIMSVAFAVFYCASVITSFLAIKTGSLALTNLIISYSLLLPTFFGIIFLNEDAKSTLLLGIIVLAAALFMTNYQKKNAEAKTDSEKPSLKWIILVLLAFFANGMCSIVQNIESRIYGDEGKSLFMIIALACVSVFFAICTLLKKSERCQIRENARSGWWLSALCGIANGLTNFFVLYLLTKLPASVMFPIISAGGMIFVFIYSITVLKEKYTLVQKIGYALGVLSIILLNL